MVWKTEWRSDLKILAEKGSGLYNCEVIKETESTTLFLILIERKLVLTL